VQICGFNVDFAFVCHEISFYIILHLGAKAMARKKLNLSIATLTICVFSGFGVNLKNATIGTIPAVAQSCNTNLEIRSNGNQNRTFGKYTTLSLCNGYKLVFQGDGNLVLYRSSGEPIWATGTEGKGNLLAIQSDGNIVLYNSAGQAIWATNTDKNSGAYFAIQVDGNMVVYRVDGQPIWSSNTAGGRNSTRSAAADWRAALSNPSQPVVSPPPSSVKVDMQGLQRLIYGNVPSTVTSPYGYQRCDIWGKSYTNCQHPALDIAALNNVRNAPLYSPVDGVVIARNDTYGIIGVYNQKSNITFFFGHMNRTDVSVNQPISKGQRIGLEGTKGYVTGSHLHFEARPGKQTYMATAMNQTMNPLDAVNQTISSNLPSVGTIVSKATGRALDAGGANGNEVYMHGSPNSGNNYHLWKLNKVGDYYLITSMATGRALDAGGANGNQIYPHPSPNPGNNYQLWKLDRVGDSYLITNKATGRALDAGGANGNQAYPHPSPNAGNNYHLWKIN
jgi:murein DD-endopeptidase MepM/ murein hydrolase activator NlpD